MGIESDMKWRRVKGITARSLRDGSIIYLVKFCSRGKPGSPYSRTMNMHGILLVEVPS